MRASWKVIVLISMVVLMAFTNRSLPTAVFARADTGCDFDLSEVSALLMQSQAKASGGDLSTGLKLLTQAQEKLAQIQARCSTQGSSTPNPDVPQLTQTFSSPDGFYSVKYPQGWITAPLNATSADKKTPKPILLASNQATVEAVNNGTPADALNGIAVYVGTQQQVIRALGAFKSDIEYSTLDAKGLVDAGIAGTSSSSGVVFGKPATITINSQQAAEATFSFVPPTGTTPKAKYDGLFLIVPLSSTQFAVLLGVTTPGQTAAIQGLVEAVGATVQLS